jgi:hypothetical protein
VPAKCELLADTGTDAAAKAAAVLKTVGKGSKKKVAAQAASKAAAVAEAACSKHDVGGGRCRWQVEQQLRVTSWNFCKNCIAESTITAEVVPVVVEG